jgi:hypothetical protein
MTPYEQFCALRDFRAPGAEVPKYSEAQAFDLALQRAGARRATTAAADTDQPTLAPKD